MKFINKLLRNIILVIMIVNITGCVTSRLTESIGEHERGKVFYKDDEITGVAATKSVGGIYQWVFIGKHFDYKLDSNDDGFFQALVNGTIDKSRIIVNNDSKFYLSDDLTRYYGSIELTYRHVSNAEKVNISEELVSVGLSCSSESNGYEKCRIFLNNISGSIHLKSTVPKNIFLFSSPFKVVFYKNNDLSLKRTLYPAAIAADVVLSPLYLIGVVAILGVYGSALL